MLGKVGSHSGAGELQVLNGGTLTLDLMVVQALESSGAAQGQYVNMLWMLLRLRQACNHPWLVNGAHHIGKPTAGALAAARRLDPPTRAALLEALQVSLEAAGHAEGNEVWALQWPEGVEKGEC